MEKPGQRRSSYEIELIDRWEIDLPSNSFLLLGRHFSDYWITCRLRWADIKTYNVVHTIP